MFYLYRITASSAICDNDGGFSARFSGKIHISVSNRIKIHFLLCYRS
ncbi:hypothetical protein HMPREF3197_01384 [Klebsiella pneumoniae]|nr:hypothetical protein HMPREF3197_01384 [Klebsiella pneumoniae]